MAKSLCISISPPDRQLTDKARRILAEPAGGDERSRDVIAICREFVSVADQLESAAEEIRRAGGH